MDEKQSEAPFPREPWKRLLASSGEAPPDTTDARIRAAARRSLPTRNRRWLLPASLAASFLLAVLVVQSQFGTIRNAIVTESDHAAESRKPATITDHGGSQDLPPPPAGTVKRRPAANPGKPSPDRDEFAATPGDAAEAAGTGLRIGGPEREIKSSSEMPRAAIAASPPVPTIGAPAISLPAAVQAPAAATNSAAAQQAAREESLAGHALATPPTPEAWYAAIQQLRAEGHVEEADRELERLRKAWPGWVEQHSGQSGQH